VQGTDPDSAAQGFTTIRLTRLPDGSIDLARLLTPRLEESAGPQSGSPPSPPWSAAIAEMSVKDARIELNDITNPRSVHLLMDQLNSVARNLSTDPAATISFEAALRWQEQGSIRAKGTATRAPLAAQVEIEAAGLLLAALDPYLEPFVAVRIADGTARASGTVTVSQDPSAAEPSIAFEGAAGLDRLVVKAADSETPLSTLGSLDLREIRFKSPPVTLNIAEIGVKSPTVGVVIEEGGKINLTSVMKSAPTTNEVTAETASATEVAAAPRPVITIDRVVIEDGRADVTDRSLSKEFASSLRDFGGTISGLSSEELARADVDLKGTLDGAAPFHVSGKINPLSEDAFTDLSVDFQGIGLAAFSPYSGRYMGYTIDRGRLTLDLTYHLSSRVLEAENKLEFDQFYLGETVESPDATKLPLKLALGLLRDRSGKIDIDLPIRGNLDDPDFKYGKVLWKAIGNLIAKAATAPFSLLGRLIPGCADPEALSYVEFAPGSETLDDSSAQKIATLANALYERPALGLEIVSRPQPGLDAQPLREQRLHRILVARQNRDVAVAGRQAVDSSAIELDATQRAALIRAEFAEAFPSKVEQAAAGPANTPAEQEESGVIKRTYRRLLGVFGRGEKEEDPPPPPPVVQQETAAAGPTLAEMESQLLARVEIPSKEFQALAEERAKVIRDHLLTTGRVEPERVSIATPDSAAEDTSSKSAPRVEFELK
jgi:hypothetical protein